MISTTSTVESEHFPAPAPVLPRTVYILTRFSPRRYVWLVPRYTTEWSAAAVGFELIIQGGANGSLQDLAKGAGGDFRYLLPVKDITNEAKVTQVTLLRLHGDMGRRPTGWTGNTGDINRNRGKTFLYLLWKTVA